MPALTLWITTCAMLIGGGWLLAAAHLFNPGGYIGLAISLALGLRRRRLARPRWLRRSWTRGWRGLRGLRLGFNLLWVLTLLGGLLHPLSTWDTLAYRLPRVCHWLAARHWHWIDAPREWMNNRSPGYEFLMAPGIALHAWRFLWVPNFITFTLLPGLVFLILRQLRTPLRAAYCWAWLLPTAHLFLLQAASTSNDMMGLLFLLASVHFALRFRSSGVFTDFAYATLSAALLTSLKLTTLPLLVVPLLLLLPAWRKILRLRPVAVIGLLLLGALCSGLPIMVLNQIRYRDWTGVRGEPDLTGNETPYLLLGNCILITAQNLAPPVIPNPKSWDEVLMSRLPPQIRAGLDRNFEYDFGLLLSEVPNEGRSGFGLPLCLLLGWLALRRPERPAGPDLRDAKLVLTGGAVASSAYLLRAGALTAARLASVHLSAVIAGAIPLLHRRSPTVVRGAVWLRLCQLHMGVCLLAVIAHPFRPLLPARALISLLPESMRNAPFAQRVVTAFEVVPGHLHAYDALQAYLPPGTRALSIVLRREDSEGQLWVRFNLDRVTNVVTREQLAALRQKPGEVILALPVAVQEHFGMTIPEFADAANAVVIGSAVLHVSNSQHPYEWFLLRVRP